MDTVMFHICKSYNSQNIKKKKDIEGCKWHSTMTQYPGN